jgi:hypothetical protein
MLLASCRSSSPGAGEREFDEGLRPLSVAACASEFYCERHRWPAAIVELRDFSSGASDPCRAQPLAAETWELLGRASLSPGPQGALAIRLDGDASEGGRAIAVALNIERPGCWPP